MKSPETFGKSAEKAERRKRVFTLLKALHPDVITGLRPDLKIAAETVTTALGQALNPTNKETSEQIAQKRITIPVRLNDSVVTIENFYIPSSVEEFIDALDEALSDIQDPTPKEERPTLENFMADLEKLTDADEVFAAFEVFQKEFDNGRIAEKDFMPTWQYLSTRAANFIETEITKANTITTLEACEVQIKQFQNNRLFNLATTHALEQKVRIAKHYLSEK